MKQRKYKEDYAIEVRMDDRGRDKRVAVYRGDYYALALRANERRSLNRQCAVRLGLFLVFYLLYMFAATPSSYCIYVLPFVSCAVFPLFYWILGAVSMARAPERMTRVQKETGVGRVLHSCTGCMVLLLLACTGDLIFVLRSGNLASEYMGFALLLCAAFIALSSMRQIRGVYSSIRVFPGRKTEEQAQKAEEKTV